MRQTYVLMKKNNNMDKIVVVTRRFPYFYTEAFLESEVPYLLKQFNMVTFLPTVKGKIRENFKDLSVCDDYCDLFSKKKLEFLKTFFSTHFYKSLYKNVSKLYNIHFFIKLIRQDIHYRVLRRVIKNNIVLFDDNTIVYSYWFDSPVYAFIKLRQELGLNYKIVTRAHRYDVYDESGEMPNRKYCIENINMIFPISQDAINYFYKKYGNLSKYNLARLGVKDYGMISRKSSGNDFHVLSVSQVSKRKRILTIHNILTKFSIQNPGLNVYWTHFGDGPLEKELKSCVDNNGCSNFFVNLGGRVSNTDIISFYKEQEIDVFINLSSSEGVPVSVMEALSFGVPVIATNVGGTSEVMSEDNGILLDASPSDEDIINALNKCSTYLYDRQIIRNKWVQTSDAETQFNGFVQKLKTI